MKKRTQTRFDWLTVDFSDIQSVSDLMRDIGLNGMTWKPLGHSFNKFNHAEVINISGHNSNVITLAWRSGRQTEKCIDSDNVSRLHSLYRYEVCVNFSGTGLDIFREYLSRQHLSLEWSILQMFRNRGKFTRIDLAHDFINFGKQYSARFVAEQIYKGNLNTSARNCRWITSFNSMGGRPNDYDSALQGSSIYIGKSPKQLRVYNKLAEEKPLSINSHGVSKFANGQCKSWQRWELQLNHSLAQDMIRNWIKNGFDVLQTWTDFMKTNYRFINRRGQKKRRRSQYPLAKWYRKIVDTGKRFEQTSEVKPIQTFKHANDWLHRQVWGVLGNVEEAKIEEVYQHCGSYEKAERIVSNHFMFNLLQYLTDKNKRNPSLIDTYLNEVKSEPENSTDLDKKFNTKGIL